MKNPLLLADYSAWLSSELSDVQRQIDLFCQSDRKRLVSYTLRMRRSELEACSMYVDAFMAQAM